MRVGIVGGGASGLAAALAAARRGAKVTLFERSPQLGRKVLASGGGRCNLGNARLDVERYHGGDAGFVRGVLSRFGLRESRRLFEELGLMLSQEADGRLFPRSSQARSVVGAFELALSRARVAVECACEVSAVRPGARGFAVETSKKGAVEAGERASPTASGKALAGGGAFEFDKVVLSCGGASYPQLGGGDRGYRLARSLGLAVVAPTPSLVPLVSKDPWVRKLQGIRVQAGLAVSAEGRTVAVSKGELLFTAYGLSGPAALDISRETARALSSRPSVDCSVDLFPEFSPSELRGLLRSRLGTLKPAGADDLLIGMLPDRVVEVFLGAHGHGPPQARGARLSPETAWPPGARPPQARAALLSPETALSLAQGLAGWKLAVCGTRSWDEAMVSAGGVELAQVCPETMESKALKGLHVTGELLDVDGDSGGYNLHFAWASGFLAGAACARR
ncbi:MAG: NAD(P)/FAD-dependent oxidoreductase [Elusimicrobia bacterium]|nr:NAD(P)/FAD-dependent oxidoreductase [Elusimicrobiota bacterium]